MVDAYESWLIDRRITWWARLSDDDRTYLAQCVEAEVCPPRARDLLNAHGSPIGTVCLQDDVDARGAFVIPESTRLFVRTQQMEC